MNGEETQLRPFRIGSRRLAAGSQKQGDDRSSAQGKTMRTAAVASVNVLVRPDIVAVALFGVGRSSNSRHQFETSVMYPRGTVVGSFSTVSS